MTLLMLSVEYLDYNTEQDSEIRKLPGQFPHWDFVNGLHITWPLDYLSFLISLATSLTSFSMVPSLTPPQPPWPLFLTGPAILPGTCLWAITPAFLWPGVLMTRQMPGSFTSFKPLFQ